MTDQITVPRFFDAHVHLRQAPLLGLLAPHTARVCGACLAMPNTDPPLDTPERLAAYRQEVEAALGPDCRLLLAAKLTPQTMPELVRACAAAGAVAFKLYPEGGTTNSHGGIPAEWFGIAPTLLWETLAAVQDAGLLLLIHGEDPRAEDPVREHAFLETGFLQTVLADFPRLRVVLEHVSTAEGAVFVARGPDRLAATVTAHHLVATGTDLTGDGLRPDYYCRPLLQRHYDREMLREEAFAHPRFFLGSDSAPHLPGAKYAARCCAGCFTAPYLAELLAGVFDEAGRLDALADFTSRRGLSFYGIEGPADTLTLRRKEWVVPGRVEGGLVPFGAGRPLGWEVVAGD